MEWKDILGFEQYEINPDAEIRNKKSNRILKNRISKSNGYVVVNLHLGEGEQKTLTVHRLVAIAFLPNPDNLPFVDHIDRDKTNPKLYNLAWSSKSSNGINIKLKKSIRLKWIESHQHWIVDVLGDSAHFTELDDAVKFLKARFHADTKK